MNNITIELCAEDRARLDKLTAELAGLRNALRPEPVKLTPELIAPTVKPEPQKAEEPKQTQPQTEEPKLVPQPEPEPTPAPAAPEVSVEDVQRKVVQLVGLGKTAEARAIVTRYAPNVSGIPADKLPEALDLLSRLEG